MGVPGVEPPAAPKARETLSSTIERRGDTVRRMNDKLDLRHAFASFTEHWRPKVVAELNGQDVRVVKIQGVFPWHQHDHAEEMFLVWRGRMRIEMRDRIVTLEAGQLFVVPRGVEHRTAAEVEAEIVIFEPSDVVNTGDVKDDVFTAQRTKI
jgi:mannose-6-phosphate isomerase-like protein (cupin superfamily)